MLMAEAAQYRRLRAPRETGQTLVEPPRDALAELVARNRQHAATLDYDLQGRSLRELAASARRTLLEAAATYTSQYRDAPRISVAEAAHRPLVLSGHQPQLFHPGVWYKNFVVGRLAREVKGVGIHLLIDSDVCREASIRVPTGSIDEPRVETVPLDAPAVDVPYEERTVQDEAAFGGAAERVVALLRPLVAEPLIASLWPLVREASGERNLGRRIARGRHRMEAQWGNDTLELPQSAVCELPEFAWFVAHVLAHLPRFWAAHNDALADYRRVHRLRNRAQPVPDLAETDGWLEAPFWMWTAEDPRRQPVYARQQGDQLLVTDGRQHTIDLVLSADGDAALAAEQLVGLAARGIKLRTRALATTLFARLFLGDLFLHGIGGAKYDQVTDQIAERFFGFSLPAFATASATLRLPIAHPACEACQLREARQQLRELKFHPERFLDGHPVSNADPAAARLVAEKQRWINTAKTPANARERHLAIAAANAALQPFVAPRRAELERRRGDAEARLRAGAVLDSRDYAFCLFPRESLEQLMHNA